MPAAEPTDYTYQREVRFKNYRIGSVTLDVSSVYLKPGLTKLRGHSVQVACAGGAVVVCLIDSFLGF